ncbi:MAG: D-2-hydroxyacid dehydrogenase [Chloroflexi bacterium]|nr:D-2-hydroxyacid dehydrogenase [Chloroflexota bacterium]
MTAPLNVLIASYIEPELVDQIRARFPQIEVVYRPDLLGAPRYVADHTARPHRTDAQEAEWQALLANADVLLDFDFTHLDDLPELAPKLKWIQASSAGIGQFVKRMRYAERTSWIFTTASGTHARPLAEFALMAMLMFGKDYQYLFSEKAAKHWARYCGFELHGKTVLIVGLGSIGRETARLAKAFGMRVTGTRRDLSKPVEHVDRLFAVSDLQAHLPEADFVVLATPHTPETENLLSAEAIAKMKHGAVLINVARGAVVDETALIAALQSGHLLGAALDVFAVEPLPADNPLWDMPNVIISPHSASTADSENAKLVELFCENMDAFLSGRPLKNVLDVDRLY